MFQHRFEDGHAGSERARNRSIKGILKAVQSQTADQPAQASFGARLKFIGKKTQRALAVAAETSVIAGLQQDLRDALEFFQVSTTSNTSSWTKG